MPDLFEIEKNNQEDDLQYFVRYISPDLHPQIKSDSTFFVSICFKYDYFIDNNQPRIIFMLFLICKSNQEYNLISNIEASMGYDLDSSLLSRHPSSWDYYV